MEKKRADRNMEGIKAIGENTEKTKKVWENQWICNPRFQGIQPLNLLHKQLDNIFTVPEHREDLKNNHTLFRKKIQIDSKIKKAILDISADDYYKLYINGTYVTQGPANSYAFCYYYNQVDITEYLHVGENIIAVHVYYQGMVNRAYNSGNYLQGMIAELQIDGEQVLDEEWKCAEAQEFGASRIIAYDTQFDEIIDNRAKKCGWKKADYDDSEWENAVVCGADPHVLIQQPCANVQMEYRKPLSSIKLSDGYLLDFGEELTGTFYMKAYGHAGDKITIRFGEELLSDQQVRHEMRCNCVYEDKLILDEGENELEQFEYKCFRYVQLIVSEQTDEANKAVKCEIDRGIQLWDFRVDYRHYPFDDSRCQFHSEKELINRIWNICKNAVRNCSQEAFLDCPSREKGQYLGDLTVTAHSLYYLTGDTELFRKALLDFAHSTVICEGMMAVAPGSFMQEIADFSLLYPYQLLLYYQFTEDQVFLREMFPVAEGIEHYFEQFCNENGMLENVKTKWNLVDWPENLRDHYDFELQQPVVGDGCHNVINALYIGMKKCVEEIRKILGFSTVSDIEELRQSFIRSFYDADRGLFVDSTISTHSSLHANVFATFFGLQPQENRIAEFIMEKGLCCGVFVAYFVLFALIRLGKPEDAYNLIINQTEHSWYNMLKEGATTAYEAWGKEQKWNTSLCHAWASAPIPVLMKLREMGVKI